MIEFDLKYYNIDIQVKQYGHYYHKHSFELDWYGYLGDYREKQLKKKIVLMNEELEKVGYKLAYHTITEEEAKEFPILSP